MILFKEGLAWTALIPPLSAGAMTVAAAALMKLQNRRAQREIALGMYPLALSPPDRRALDEARTT
jgi:hypothetical protein